MQANGCKEINGIVGEVLTFGVFDLCQSLGELENGSFTMWTGPMRWLGVRVWDDKMVTEVGSMSSREILHHVFGG